MFREFELVMWSCFACKDDIDAIIKDDEKQGSGIDTKIINHLVNTAYYCKSKVTS